MNITGKESDLKKIPPDSRDKHYVDITERAHNHFIRYAVVRSYDINDVDTKTIVYSGTLHIPKDWTEGRLEDYLHERHTKFSDPECLDTKIIILQLYPLQSVVALDEHQDAKKVQVTSKLMDALESVDDEEDEFDRKMRILIHELEDPCFDCE